MRHIFIINPNLSNMNAADKIRNKLKEKADFDYLVFNTEYAGHETVLVRQMEDLFEDEKIRFYCCGGMGTFSNMLNGIKNFEKTEITLYPCGVSCDILKVFGFLRRHFTCLQDLIDGVVMPMDFIETDRHRAVNTLLCGMGTKGVKKLDVFRHNHKQFEPLAYCGTGIASICIDRSSEYELILDDVHYDGKYKQIYIANGCCMGAKFYPIPEANPFDGELNIMLLHNLNTRQLLSILKDYRMGELQSRPGTVDIIKAKKFTIRKKSKNPIMFNSDGEYFYEDEMTGRVMEKKLKFVVPRIVMSEMCSMINEE